jgi:hypothetical protein
MNAKKLTGVAIALSAASMFATATISDAFAQGVVSGIKCEGGNACKGKSECKSAKNECKGKNACRGKGFVMAKEDKECKELQMKYRSDG